MNSITFQSDTYIIKVLFTRIHQMMRQWIVLKNNVTIYIKTAPTSLGGFSRCVQLQISHIIYKIYKSDTTNLVWDTGSSEWQHISAFLL